MPDDQQARENPRYRELLKNVGWHDGAEIEVKNCRLHGLTHHLVIFNQGGYDATSCCLRCAVEILGILEDAR